MENYFFTGKTKVVDGVTLKQIECEMYGVGGWIESKSNLSQYDSCWVSENAMVFGNARVCEDAQVSGNAKVYGYAKVYSNAEVGGNAEVFGDSVLTTGCIY